VIRSVLKLEEVKQVIGNDSSQVAKLTDSISEKSKKHRSVTSNRLVTSSVMAASNYCKQSRLERHAILSHVLLSPKWRASEMCKERHPKTPNTASLPSSTASSAAMPSYIGLVTGEQSLHQMPSYTFKFGYSLSEVPGGSLLITDGGMPALGDVVRIYTVESL
jgi:hypothetical protein